MIERLGPLLTPLYHGIVQYTQKTQVSATPLDILRQINWSTNRGKGWCRIDRSHLHGRYGLRNGLLLFAAHIPELQCG